MKIGIVALSLVAFVSFMPSPAHGEGEIGFLEKFALSSDRETVLAELIPGSDDYYFFHALHYQNTRQKEKLRDILEQWKKRRAKSPQREIIENREALLSYDATPQETLAFLRKRLDLHFDHEPETPDQKANLPSALDQGLISRDVFQTQALKSEDSLEKVADEGLERLVREKATLNPAQIRSLLSRLKRPDAPNLLDFIATDLKSKESHGFGEFDIHRALLPEQLDDLVRRIPSMADNQAFIYARLDKLVPGADAAASDPAEREAWLDRVWAYVSSLPAAYNSLKLNVLYQRLQHDRSRGMYDEARFLTYLKLPRRAGYINPEFFRAVEHSRAMADLDANDFPHGLLLLSGKPVHNDESLVRDYFLHLLPQLAERPSDLDPADLLKKWTPYVRDTWLKPVLAEAMITNGIGQPERWASLISPSAFQVLKDRVDVEFSPANREFLSPEDDVSLDLFLKNTPKLIVKIYEINALSYFLANHRELNTDLPLDGLVANREITHDFSAEKDGANPFRRAARTFKFPELKGKRGAWIIEFIGGGKSSRALVRKGQWSVIQRIGPAGDMLTVLDEAHQPVKDAVVWIDGRKFIADEKSGFIILPFARQPSETAVLSDASGEFATLASIQRHAETYTLDAHFHIAREQLLAGSQATLAIRSSLLIQDARLPLELLENVRLSITSTTLDGVVTTSEQKIAQLDSAKAFIHTFVVPDRLLHLKVELSAQVASMSNAGQKQELNASDEWTVNQMDREEATSDAHLSKIGDGYVFELLGKNGEPLANQAVEFEFTRNDFVDSVNLSLATDEKGRIDLGELRGIQTINCPNRREWTLPRAERTWSSAIHAKAGDPITIPWSGDAPPDHVSLLEVRGGTFVANFRAAITGFPEGAWNPAPREDPNIRRRIPQLSAFVLKGLPPGDYSLSFGGEGEPIVIRITDGKPVGNWLISSNRELEVRSDAPLNIQSVARDGDEFVIQLASAGQDTRVHIAASRFLPDTSVFDALGAFTRFDPATGAPASLPNLFAAGRQIGDEYRYILDRRYSKIFPGNMLSRPGLILDPWEVRSTDLQSQQMAATQRPGSTAGGRAATASPPAPAPVVSGGKEAEASAHADLEFLAKTAPVCYNLTPDARGAIRISAKEFGDRQYLQIYAEDLTNAVSRTLSLPEAPTLFKDLRLMRALDPQKPSVERKEQTVLAKGETLKLADILTSELQTYDSLAAVYALLSTLSRNADLIKFAWILDWPKLKLEEKQAKYSEFACHELNFFLQRKDPEFFAKVILPYLQNKKEKTFMDDFLLGDDLRGYLAPWAHARLNAVERCLLAQRIPGEAAATARNLRELWELLPPDLGLQNFLFETALRGSSLHEVYKKSAPSPDEAAAPQGPVRIDYGVEVRRPVQAQTSTTTLRKTDSGVMTPEQMQIPGNTNVFFGGATSTTPVSSNRSGNDAISSNAIDALLFNRKAKHLSAGESTATTMGASIYPAPAAQIEPQLSPEEAKRQRALVRQFFRSLGPTKEWAENDYYKIPLASQNVALIPINAFWRDYAAWDGKSPFVSANFAEAAHNFSEMMLALSVLDLPFESPKHATKSEAREFALTAGGPLVAFHKEIEPAAPPKENRELLVSENFYRNDDRYRTDGNEKSEKYVTGEFLSGVVYGASVVVTNPSSAPQVIDLLLQIPEGALPVRNSKATDSKRFRVDAYTTRTFDYFFYFPTPRPEPFLHYPASVTHDGQSAGAAKPTTFKVVQQLSSVDKTSWDYVSQFGSEEDVFAFLDRETIARLDLTQVAWRARKSAEFFHKLIALLAKRHTYNDVLYSYAVFHNDAPTLGEWLRHRDDFLGQCGPWLSSKLLTIDPVERRAYQHLEYAPFVNQRAHQLGPNHRIPNPVLRAQFLSLLNILAFKPGLDAMDQMSVTYYLFLQDRTEEALVRFHSIPPAALPTRLQYDYFQCYAAFFEERPADARGIANQYADYPVDRWRQLFADVSTQLDEMEGKAAAPGKAADKPDREARQSDLVATEPSFDFKVENRQIALTWKNLSEVTVRYYLMDPEFLFSASPFVTQDSARVSIVKPTKTSIEKLPEGKDALQIPLPGEFEKANVLVEILAAGQWKSQAYHANTLKLAVAENYGRLELRDQAAGKPVPKAYVKVYARLKGGTIRFFKDGYTDLRGKFDYASLNGSDTAAAPQNFPSLSGTADDANYQMLQPQELHTVEKLSILILSDAHGALVREVDPPAE
jgi:hypothetical protein